MERHLGPAGQYTDCWKIGRGKHTLFGEAMAIATIRDILDTALQVGATANPRC